MWKGCSPPLPKTFFFVALERPISINMETETLYCFKLSFFTQPLVIILLR